VTEEWARVGRPGRPRILTGRYFCCGPEATALTDAYVAHYYGSKDSPYFEPVRAECLDSDERLREELAALSEAGVDDLVLYPASSSPEQVRLLAEALVRAGARRNPTFEFAAGSGGRNA
jgi:hypothetical protein